MNELQNIYISASEILKQCNVKVHFREREKKMLHIFPIEVRQREG